MTTHEKEDLVLRLRKEVDFNTGTDRPTDLLKDATNEIEKLRQENKELNYVGDHNPFDSSV